MQDTQKLNCMIAGVGGQGTVLLSRLIGMAAIEKGYAVKGAETIGMAQRGGSVLSHVRLAHDIADLHSPLIPQGGADLLIAFEAGEGARALPYLGKNGTIIVVDRIVKPVTSSLAADGYAAAEMIEYIRQNAANVIVIDADAISSPKTTNVALLGVSIGAELLPIDVENAKRAITDRLPEKFHTKNFQALQEGIEFAITERDRI